MATTATSYSGWYNIGRGEYRLRITLTRTAVNIGANTSTVRSQVWIEARAGGYFWGIPSTHGHSIDGVQVYSGTINRDVTNGGSTLVLDNSRTVSHAADGTRAVGTAATFQNSFTGSMYVATSLTLDTIPRATTPSLSGGGGFVTGAAKVILLPRASSGFTHDVTWRFGSLSGTVATGAGVSATWTPAHSLLTQIPNAVSGSVTITVVTKSGGAAIGTKAVAFSLAAAPEVLPTVDSVSWDDSNPTVKAAIGAFVQGLSLVKAALSATGVHGSTIKERRIRVGDTLIPESMPVQITAAGTVAAAGEAIDSRGRLGTTAAPFSVLAYAPPRLGANSWKVSRANSANAITDGGQYLRIDLHAIVSTLKVGTVEKNSLTIKVRTKASNGGWVNRNTIAAALTHNAAIQVSGGGIFLASTSYEVEVTLSDKTGSTPTVLKTVVPTAAVTIDLNGTNVGIGKYHERGTLDVAGEIYSTDGVSVWKSSTLEARLTDLELAFKSGSVLTQYGRTGINATGAFLLPEDTRFPKGGASRTMQSGTAAQREATTPRFGDIWYDTDGPKYKWKGSSTGLWRRCSGTVRFTATAWDNSGNGIWARTAAATIPTAVEVGEDIVLSTAAVANGFGSASRSGVSASNWITLTTDVHIRHYQFLNAQTNPVDMHWEVIDI